jgi:hypothetical protein
MVTSVSADETATQLNVEAGGVYYVVQRVRRGMGLRKSSLAIVPEETGVALVNLHMSQPRKPLRSVSGLRWTLSDLPSQRVVHREAEEGAAEPVGSR